ncbi:MAG: polysaccharide deacetylase family protein [Anaerovoracaceae bacterium]|jgi:peptidoglycan/xylan/chitin deacetylase (PgdA/CDA1 family)
MTKYRIRRDRRSGCFIAVIVVIVVAVIAFLVIRHVMTGDSYHSKGSFERYASKYYDSIGGNHDVGRGYSRISYGEPLSEAIKYPKLNDISEKQAVKKVITSDRKNFEARYSGLSADDKAALLIGYESYNTPEKAVGVAIHEKQTVSRGDRDSTPVDKVYTFNFATKTGAELDPPQIFRGDYLDPIAKKVKEKLSKNHDDLKSKGLAATDDNYSKFILTDKGIKFFFDAGRVAPKSDGVISTEISYDSLKSCMRDDIGERVIDPKKPMVAITYDDGPDEKCTNEILDVYDKHNAVCTFFELGKNVDTVKGADKILKRELDLGCEVGTHSYDHPNQLTLNSAQIRQQAEKSKAAIKKACGQEPTIGRPPYGNGSTKIAKISDLPLINWDVDTQDWKSRNAKAVISRVKAIPNYDGAVILMHSIYQSSADATATIVPYLQKKGYQLVTVSELLEYHYGEKPQKGKWYGYTFETLNK